jgi:hypothetical protein
MLKISYDMRRKAMIRYNAYEIEKARRDYIQEGDSRERLAHIARAGSASCNPIVRLLKKTPGHIRPAHQFSLVRGSKSPFFS